MNFSSGPSDSPRSVVGQSTSQHAPQLHDIIAGRAPPAPPIPSYEAATSIAPEAVAASPLHQHVAAADELPDYTVVDSNQTSFLIYGTFIYTPNGPAYQLSSLLDATIPRLRIRRLRAEDVALIESGRTRTVAFDKSTTLYEAHDPPFLQNEFYISGHAAGTWQSTLQLRFGFRRWHIRQVQKQGVEPKPLLTCGKTGALAKRILRRKNEMEPSEWKDSHGRVLATEVLRLEGGRMLPTMELSKDLDSTWRELMLALWVSRLWAGFGAGST